MAQLHVTVHFLREVQEYDIQVSILFSPCKFHNFRTERLAFLLWENESFVHAASIVSDVS